MDNLMGKIMDNYRDRAISKLRPWRSVGLSKDVHPVGGGGGGTPIGPHGRGSFGIIWNSVDDWIFAILW